MRATWGFRQEAIFFVSMCRCVDVSMCRMERCRASWHLFRIMVPRHMFYLLIFNIILLKVKESIDVYLNCSVMSSVLLSILGVLGV